MTLPSRPNVPPGQVVSGSGCGTGGGVCWLAGWPTNQGSGGVEWIVDLIDSRVSLFIAERKNVRLCISFPLS